jgi:hypothetical protein
MFEQYHTIVLVIAVLCLLYIFFSGKCNNNGEKFTMNIGSNTGVNSQKTKYKAYTDGQTASYITEPAGIYYGVDGGKGVYIGQDIMNNLTQNTNGQFTCLPKGFKGSRGYPVLPVDDPVPGIAKKCYVYQSQ